MFRISLLGMPNCGKSTLFHLLTGHRVPTGNRPGVTVSAVSFPLRGEKNILLTDLPGIRSVPVTSPDEAQTLSSLVSDPPDLLLAVLDATDLPRQLPVIASLLPILSQKISPFPRVAFVFNCCDELSAKPDPEELSRLSGFPSFAVSARTGSGVDRLSERLSESLSGTPSLCRGCEHDHRCAFSSHVKQNSFRICLPSVQKSVISAVGNVSRRKKEISDRIDRVFLRTWCGIPLFFAAAILTLYLTFGTPGNLLTDLFCTAFLSPLSALFRSLFSPAPAWIRSLIDRGVIGGVGAVLSFLPRLCLLFFLQSLTEQTGLLSRVGILFDPFFKRFGLRGDAAAPILLGFGCTVPAVLTTRSMKDRDAADRCAVCLPVIACSARMPFCLLLANRFRGAPDWLICTGVWLGSGIVFLFFCALMSKFSQNNATPARHDDPLPRWRVPAPADLLSASFDDLRHFLSRAGGTVFLSSLLIWLLSSFSFGEVGTVPAEESILSDVGRFIAPLFAPLGFGDWRVASALICALFAKETAVSTLGVLFGMEDLSLALTSLLTPAAALSLTVFYTLYFPCLATVSTLRGEKKRLRALLLPLLFAYVFAGLIYRIFSLIPVF